jgi:phage shock protein PspC (stress-responsive transcriptional regulator)
MKKLYLSRTDKKLAGVVGGLAEYYEVDSTVLRIVFLLILVFTGFFPGLIFYIAAAMIMPKKPA